MQNQFRESLAARMLAASMVLTAPAMLAAAPASAGSDEGAQALSYSSYLSEVDDGVMLAGSLDLDALRASHEGAVEIIDLRTEPEGTLDEAAQAETLGLKYTNIPVSSATVDPAQVDALRVALSAADPESLVIVHCASGNRAGMLWGAAQLANGIPLAIVQEKVATIMTKQPAIDGLDVYAKTLDAEL